MKLGKTIVAAREEVQTESERLKIKAKEARKKRVTTVVVVVAMVTVAGAGVLIARELMKARETEGDNVPRYQPTVAILDEDGGGYITDKMSEYVGKIERDFYDLGYKVAKAIVPSGKAREIDVYVEGREEYYKCNLDRGTAETVEDVVRMIKYLDSKEIDAKYVDVRVEEKAYYL